LIGTIVLLTESAGSETEQEGNCSRETITTMIVPAQREDNVIAKPRLEKTQIQEKKENRPLEFNGASLLLKLFHLKVPLSEERFNN